MTAPGVPDVYQGTEFYDYSLVDPDNRRAIDFGARADAMTDGLGLEEALNQWRDGRAKAKLVLAALKARGAAPEPFTEGDYLPLEVAGTRAAHVVAFARVDSQGRAAIVVAPRLTLKLLGGGRELLLPAAFWEDTAVRLPPRLTKIDFSDGLASAATKSSASVSLASLFAKIPIALLVAA